MLNHKLLNICQEHTTAKHILLHIRKAILLPARRDGAIILPASKHMNHHVPAGTSYQWADLYQLAGVKPPLAFFHL